MAQVSGIRLAPAGRHLIASLVRQYRIDVIADTGDTTDHNPAEAAEADGLAPPALAGHLPRREIRTLPRGSRLRVGGSTGGDALRAVQNRRPAPVQASAPHPARTTKRLQTWDEITLGGPGSPAPRTAAIRPARAGPHRRAPPPPPARPGRLPTGPGKPFWRTVLPSHMLLTSPTEPATAPRRAISPHRLVAQDAALSRR